MPATKVLQKEKEELASKLKEREEKCDKLAKDLEEMEEKKNYWVRQFRERGRTMESLKDELEQLHATDTHTEIQDTAGELREHKSMVKLLLPMAKRQIKERFMLEVCGAELEREKEEGGISPNPVIPRARVFPPNNFHNLLPPADVKSSALDEAALKVNLGATSQKRAWF